MSVYIDIILILCIFVYIFVFASVINRFITDQRISRNNLNMTLQNTSESTLVNL